MSDNTETQLSTEGGSTPRACSSSSDAPESREEWRRLQRGPDGAYSAKVTYGDLAHGMSDFARKMERERDQWKAKYIQQNKDLGCELRDPNGTIWEHAAAVNAINKRYKAALVAIAYPRRGTPEERWGIEEIAAHASAALSPENAEVSRGDGSASLNPNKTSNEH